MELDALLYISILYGFVLFIWNFIKPVYIVLHKKDFIKYWNICSVLYWIVTLITWKIYKILKIYPSFNWPLLSIIFCLISNIYFIVFRYFSHQEIIKESISKNEKIGIAIVSLIHFLLSPIPSQAFFYIIQRLVSFLVRLTGRLHVLL